MVGEVGTCEGAEVDEAASLVRARYREAQGKRHENHGDNRVSTEAHVAFNDFESSEQYWKNEGMA